MKTCRSSGGACKAPPFSSIILVSLLTLPACLNQKSLFGSGADATGGKQDPSAQLGDFSGCIDGQGLDSQTISLNFEFPAKAEKMSVYRNGVLVFTSSVSSVTSFTDSPLVEGKSYLYTCEASISGTAVQGKKSLTLSTLSTNPPTFAGVKTVQAINATTVRVTWSAPSGVLATKYNIFANLGTQNSDLNFSATPVKNVGAGILTADVTGLHDELPYVFGVQACSEAGVCDSNTEVKALSTPDGGAPTTTGAVSVVMDSNGGGAVITAPWTASNGGLKYRRVYQKSGTNPGIDLTSYTLVQENTVSDSINPITSFTITGLVDNTQYNYIVQDEDPTGNKSTNRSVVNVNSGDLTAPTFAGLTSVSAGSPADTAITINFTAIDTQPTNPNGASQYLIYITTNGSNACSSGTLATQFDATAYTSGQAVTYNFTGRTPRTDYTICLKARDSAGNISATTAQSNITTKDLTAPTFAGITGLAYNSTLNRVDVGWTASSSSDLLEYKLKIWKNQVSPPGSPTILTKASSSNQSSSSILPTDFSYTDGDTLYVVVNACDNASPTYGTQNCTTLSTPATLLVPDVTPPQNFLGIRVSSALSTPSEGAVTVAWTAPSDWSDYRGFKVYSVDSSNAITFLKDCACSAAACPDHLSSCTVTGLGARRTYTFHVKAYDAAGNLTSDPSVASSKTAKLTTDTTPPTFVSTLAIGYSSGVTLTWNAATDNQYASESGAVINYRIYRKQGSTFAAFSSGSTPPSDGTLLATQGGTTYTDLASNLSDGVTYYYTVCTQDTSLNVACDATVKSKLVPDITPPASFAGIKSAPNLTTPSQGAIGVTWLAPASWTDYSGFKVYSVDTGNSNALTEIGDCPCSGNNCPDQITSCTVTGLDARRTYTLHVRAYDAYGNLTTYLDPSSSKAAKTTIDTTVPTFSSSLSLNYASGTVNASWSAATDNQYASESGAIINYLIYRKADSTFASFSAGSTLPSDGSLQATQTTRTLADVPTGLGGSTLYYTVCAQDASGNHYCDGSVQSIPIPDLTAPVITSLTSTKTTTNKSWDLTWSMTDNSTSSANLFVQIYRKVGTTNAGSDLPTGISGELLTSGFGLTSLSSETNISGTANAEKYVNYRIVATDTAGNPSTAATLSVYIDNKAPITDPVLTSFTPTSPSRTSTTPTVVGTSSADTATVALYSNSSCSTGNLLVSGSKATFEGSGLGITVSSNSTTTVFAQASDTAANKGTCVSFGSYVHDTVTPTIASVTVTTSSPTNSTSVAVTWGSTADSPTQYCTLVNSSNVASCSWQNTPLPSTVSIAGADGAKTIYAWVRDGAGNTSTSVNSSSITLDTTLPVWGNSISHAAWSTSGSSFGSISYSQNASDASGILKYQYAIGTGTSGAALNDQRDWTDMALSSFTASGLSLGEGLFYVNMRALDTAGNAKVNSSSGFTVDYTAPSNPVITSIGDGQAVTITAGGTYTFTGTCDSSSGNTTTVTGGSNVTILSSSCASSVLTISAGIIGLNFSSGSTRSVSVYTSDTAGNVSSTVTRNILATGVCPPNYVGVAANATYGTSDFCVAKYEMKAVTSNPTAGAATLANSGNGNNTYTATWYPDSRPDGTPFVNIQQRQAAQQCDRLNNGASSTGTGAYQLITNDQWQALAANISAKTANWSGGAVGSGKLARGHTDNSLADSGTHAGNLTTGTTNQGLSSGLNWSGSNALAASSTDGSTIPYSTLTTPALEFAAGYRGTGNYTTDAMGSGFEQRRTQYLASGEVIWDVAGNVWEWVRYTNADGVIDGGFTTPSGATNSASNYNSRYIPTQSSSMGASNWYEIGNPAVFSSSFTCYLLGVGSSCTGNGGLNSLRFQPSGNFWNNTSGTYPSDFNLGRIYTVSAGASSTYAVLRGGFWVGVALAGVFSSNLAYAPTDTFAYVGFRCAVSP